jgi:uncharacterized protein (DUF433 family)
LAISKVIRRNKDVIKHGHLIEDIFSTRDMILKHLAEAEDGMTLGEIYKKFPNLTNRGIREHVMYIKQNDLLILKTCRCHAATVYYLK